MTEREFSPSVYEGLKRTVYRAVRKTGGIEAAAEITGRGKSQIGLYQQKGSDIFMPLDVALDIDRFNNEPLITRRLARELGFKMLATRKATAKSPAELVHSLNEMLGEHSQLMAGILGVLGAGENFDLETLERLRDISNEHLDKARRVNDLIQGQIVLHKGGEGKS